MKNSEICTPKSTKPGEDWERARRARELWAAGINPLIDDKARLARLHPYLTALTPAEKRKNNCLINRIQKGDALNAMGLDYFLEAEWTSTIILISFRRADDHDIYYKLPSDSDPDEFISTILSKIHFLFVNPDRDNNITRYALLQVNGKDNDLRWAISTSEGNRNRAYVADRRWRCINPIKHLSWADIEDTPKNKYGLGIVPHKQCIRDCLLTLLEEQGEQ